MAPTLKPVKRKVHACAPCRRLKMGCDGQIPCGPCFTASLPCAPQPRDGEEFIPIGQRALNRADPRVMVEGFMQVYYGGVAEGLVDRDATLSILRVWRETSLLAGSDVTWGMGTLMCQRWGISPVELEGPRALALGGSAEGRRRLAQEALARGMALSEQLKASDMFRLLDDGQSALCLMAVDAEGGIARATNGACDRMFRASMEMYDDFTLRHTSSLLLSAAFIAPDDRPAWFRLQLEACFQRGAPPRTILAKQFTRDGTVELFIFSCRTVEVHGHPALCFLTSRARANRHVSATPDAPHRARRQKEQQQPQPQQPQQFKPPPRPHGGLPIWASSRLTGVKRDHSGHSSVRGSGSVSSFSSFGEPPTEAGPAAIAAAAAGAAAAARGACTLPTVGAGGGRWTPVAAAPGLALAPASGGGHVRGPGGGGADGDVGAGLVPPPAVLPGIASLPVPPPEPREALQLLPPQPQVVALPGYSPPAAKGRPPPPSPSPRSSAGSVSSSAGSAFKEEDTDAGGAGGAAADTVGVGVGEGIFRTRPEVLEALVGHGQHPPPPGAPPGAVVAVESPPRRRSRRRAKRADSGDGGGVAAPLTPETGAGWLMPMSPFPEYPSPSVPLALVSPLAPPPPPQQQQQHLLPQQMPPAVFYGVAGQPPAQLLAQPPPLLPPPPPPPPPQQQEEGQEAEEAELWDWLASGLSDMPADALGSPAAAPPVGVGAPAPVGVSGGGGVNGGGGGGRRPASASPGGFMPSMEEIERIFGGR